MEKNDNVNNTILKYSLSKKDSPQHIRIIEIPRNENNEGFRYNMTIHSANKFSFTNALDKDQTFITPTQFRTLKAATKNNTI